MDQPLHLPAPPEVSESPPSLGAAPSIEQKPKRTWVPVRSLTSRHRDRIRAHLLALGEHDRYLRFGYAASDAQINHYADSIDLDRDEAFGIFNRRLELIAMAHLAYSPTPQISGKPAMAEFGVSVLHGARGRGLGARLFDHAVLHARNRHIETLFIHALSENTAMLRIAHNAGAKVERQGSESEAWLTLPPDDMASQVGAVMEAHAAEFDYRLKAQAKTVHQFIRAITDVQTHVAGGVCKTPE